MFNTSEDSGLKSFVGRSYIVLGLPLRLGRTWPLSSMLAEAETNLHMTRGKLGRLAWRLLEWVKAEALWKGRRSDSVTRVGKQGNKVNAIELKLILPPIRVTSCIQFASRCFGDVLEMGSIALILLLHASPTRRFLCTFCKISVGAYRVCIMRHGPSANLLLS